MVLSHFSHHCVQLQGELGCQIKTGSRIGAANVYLFKLWRKPPNYSSACMHGDVTTSAGSTKMCMHVTTRQQSGYYFIHNYISVTDEKQNKTVFYITVFTKRPVKRWAASVSPQFIYTESVELTTSFIILTTRCQHCSIMCQVIVLWAFLKSDILGEIRSLNWLENET